MLKELQFVSGAVAKKDFVPIMTHFIIDNGTVRAYNGVIALCTPIPLDLSCQPKAEPLVKAIRNCTETAALSMTPAKRLKVESGKFRAFIDCINETREHIVPEGKIVKFDGEQFLSAIRTISDFVGDDASRPWSNGILLRGKSAFATNNVCLIEYWLGEEVPFTVNIPTVAVKEILRINAPPLYAQLTPTSITFHYNEQKWLRSQLLSTEWPDMSKILDKECSPIEIDSRIFTGLETINAFLDKKLSRVFFKDERMFTHEDEQVGASYDLSGNNMTGVYSPDMLKLLNNVVTTIDFSTYPAPCLFFGDKLRGAIIGMRQ